VAIEENFIMLFCDAFVSYEFRVVLRRANPLGGDIGVL
jgi:hypothetical protein